MKYLALLITIPLLATTYYVDQDGVHGTVGDDSYSGKSWDEPWATITKAANTLQAGDSVIIGRAIYREQVEPRNSGTEDEPICYIGEDNTKISASNPITDYISYGEIKKESNHDYVYYFVVPTEITDSVGPLADMAKVDSTRRVDVVSHNGSMTYHRWIKGLSHGSKHGGANDKADGLRITNSMGATYYFEPAESDTYFFSTNDRLPPDSAKHGLEITMRKHALYIQDKDYLIFKNIEFWGGRPDENRRHPTAIYVFRSEGSRFEEIEVYNGAVLAYYLIDGSISNFLFGNGVSILGGNNVFLEDGEICNKYENLAHFELVDNLKIKSTWIHDSFNNYYIDQNGYGWDVANEKWKAQGRTHGLQICGHLETPAKNTLLDRVCITRTHDGLHPYILDTVKIYNCVFNSSCINGPLQLPGKLQRINLHRCSHIKIRNCLFLNSTTEGGNSKGICAVDGESTAVEIDSDYNCFCHCRIPVDQTVWRVGSNYLSLDEVQSIYGQEEHSFEINSPPLPVICDEPPQDTDYHLYEGSILIDAGDPSFDPPPGGGNTIDIGAYEYIQIRVAEGENQTRRMMVVVPNPFNDFLKLSFSDGLQGKANLKIVDVAGRVVFRDEISLDKTAQLNTGNLRSGVYFLVVGHENFRKVNKVLLVR